MKRCRLALGSAELIRANREAHTGADALVPPFGADSPSRMSEYNGRPANAATSGTIRPLMDPVLMEGISTVCQDGREKVMLTPPPVAPPPLPVRCPGDSHQTTSWPENIVPPTESTNGLHPGNSTWARLSAMSHPVPSSPEETQIVIPSMAAA